MYKCQNNLIDMKREKFYHVCFVCYRECIDYVLAITEKTRSAGAVSSSDIPEIWLMCVQVSCYTLKEGHFYWNLSFAISLMANSLNFDFAYYY